MNLVCNNCASGFVYQKLGIEYNNPFMWNLISVESFKNLMCQWNSLNLAAIKLPNEPPLKGVPLIIDSKVEVKYIHILYDKDASTPYKKFVDVYSNAPWTYAINKYITRLKRMLACKQCPIFLISDDHTTETVDTIRPDNSIKLMDTLNEAKIPYKIVWATQHSISKDRFSHLDLTIIHPSNQYVGTVADELITSGILGVSSQHGS